MTREKPEIPWHKMISFQNFLTHYYGVNWDGVWKTVESDLPSLKRKIDTALEQAERADEHSNKMSSIASRQELAKAIDDLLQAK